MKYLLLVSLLFPISAKAENSLLHPVAHIGASYTINHITYTLVNELTDNPFLSLCISIPTTLVVGLAYKYIEDKGTLKYLKSEQLVYNATGLALSIITIQVNLP
jgi:hypothetical protein